MNGRQTLTDHPDRFPRPFGNYLLLSPLGKGGMGEVFLAKRRGAVGTEVCVVKMLRADLVKDREYVTRFVDEARVVVNLQHPNICHVFDVGRSAQGQYYLAMEYLSGVDAKTLHERAMQQKRVVETGACVQIAIDVLAALDYAHKRKHPKTGEPLQLIHRDISPHNVVVGFDGVSKIIDFGLASSTMKMEQTAPNVVMGKMAYMGPEQARGDAIDATADQFAAAMVFYELLTGERFYEGLTPNEIWNTVGRGGFRPRAFKQIDRPLRSMLDKALHKTAGKRFADCNAFRDALATYQERTFPAAGGEAVAAAIADLMGQELEDEWERMAGFGEVSLSGFTHELEVTGRQAQVIAQATPGSGPQREMIPPPRPARPSDPTAIIDGRSLSGPSGEAHGHSGGGAESTELVSRRNRSVSQPSDPTQVVVRDRSVPSGEATALVRDRSLSGGAAPAAQVVVVHPSQAHLVNAPQPNRLLVAAVGGLLALLLLGIGALLMDFASSSEPDPKVAAQDGTDSTATGVRRQTDPEASDVDGTDSDGNDPEASLPQLGEPEPPEPEVATEVPADEDPDALDSAGKDDPRARRRRSRSDRKGRRADPKPADPTPTKTQPAADLEKQRQQAQAEAAQVEARRRADRREENEALLRKGKRRLKKRGYANLQDWPSNVLKAYQKADADPDDSALARRFEKLTSEVPKKAAPPRADSGEFDFVGRLNKVVRTCLRKQLPCAKDLTKERTKVKALNKLSSGAKNSLKRKIIQCEKACGL